MRGAPHLLARHCCRHAALAAAAAPLPPCPLVDSCCCRAPCAQPCESAEVGQDSTCDGGVRGCGGGSPSRDEDKAVADVEKVSRHLRHTGVRSRAYALLLARTQVLLAHFLLFPAHRRRTARHLYQHVVSTRGGRARQSAAAKPRPTQMLGPSRSIRAVRPPEDIVVVHRVSFAQIWPPPSIMAMISRATHRPQHGALSPKSMSPAGPAVVQDLGTPRWAARPR